MNSTQYPSPHAVAEQMRREIADLITEGTVPLTVTEFWQLHDYVDANLLGQSLFPQPEPDSLSEAEWTLHLDRVVTILNAAQEEVNVWLLRR